MKVLDGVHVVLARYFMLKHVDWHVFFHVLGCSQPGACTPAHRIEVAWKRACV